MSVDELIPRLAKPAGTVAESLGHVLGIARKIDSREGAIRKSWHVTRS